MGGGGRGGGHPAGFWGLQAGRLPVECVRAGLAVVVGEREGAREEEEEKQESVIQGLLKEDGDV